MKKAIILAALCAAGLAQAGAFDPDWAGETGSVYAVWDSWASYSAGAASAADYTEAYNPNNGAVAPYAGSDGPDVLSTLAFKDADMAGNNWLDLGTSDDLSFWMPTFDGLGTTEAVIQLTYWDDTGDASWRAGFDLNAQLSDSSIGNIAAFSYLGEDHDTASGLITEAWAFTVNGATDGFFADFVVDQSSIDLGGVFVEEVSIDAISYEAIPEPASMAFMLTGGVFMALIRRKFRR